MLTDTNIGENKAFFRVKRVLDELKLQPDYEEKKYIALMDLAKELVKEVETSVDSSKIRGLKFSGTTIVTAEMNENEILQEVMKAIEERLNIDVAIENLTSLVRFWKRANFEKDIYKPIIDELIRLLDESQYYLKEKDKINTTKALLKSKEELNKSLNERLDQANKMILALGKESEDWKGKLQPILNHYAVIKDFNNYLGKANPVSTHYTTFRSIVMYLLTVPNMRDYLATVAQIVNSNEAIVKKIAVDYNEFLDISPKGNAIGIKKKDNHTFNIEAYLKNLRTEVRDENENDEEDEEYLEDTEQEDEETPA